MKLEKLATFILIGLSVGLMGASKDEIYKEVCSYDPWCTRLKSGDGSFIEPEKTQATLIRKYAATMQKEAKKFGVDPLAIFGAILTENSLNVTIKDSIQSGLARLGITGMGSKQFSFGMGQINMPAAESAERVMAKIEGRPVRSSTEIRERLLTPEGAIEYAAGILREANDAYQAVGIDISKDVPLQITLYNLGQYKKRAKEAESSGNPPRQNYFGAFYKLNEAVFREQFEKGMSEKGPAIANGGFGQFQSSKFQLSASPPFCQTYSSRGAAKDYYAMLTKTRPAQLTPAGTSFQRLGATIDCDGQEWVLVDTFHDGLFGGTGRQMGWLPADQFNKFAKATSQRSVLCSSASEKCRKDVLEAYGEKEFIDQKPGLSFLPLKVFGSQESKKDGTPDWTKFDASCLEGTRDLIRSQSSQRGPRKDDFADKFKISEADAKAYQEKLQAKQTEITDHLKITNWYDSNNPYTFAFENLKYALQDCLSHSSNGGCFSKNREDLDKFLKVDFTKIDSLKKYEEVTGLAGTQFYRFRAPLPPQPSPTPAPTPDPQIAEREIGEVEKVCGPAAKDLPSSMKEVAGGLKSMRMATKHFPHFQHYLGEIAEKCKDMTRVRRFYEKGEKQWQESDHCSLSLPGSSMQLSNRLTFGLVQAIKIPPDELDQILQRSISPFFDEVKRLANNGPDPFASNCSYSPIDTVKAIEKLTQNPCVESVLVSDPDLVRAIRVQDKKVVNYPIEQTDRIAVRMKQECTVDKSIPASPSSEQPLSP